MNIHEKSLSFFPVEENHLNIILEWLKKSHVKEFYYGEGLENTIKNLNMSLKGIKNNGRYSFENWIAYISGKPFGYLMTSPFEGPYNSKDPFDKWFKDGKETITLDLLIGEDEYLGIGLGHRMIQEFLLDKFPHVTEVLIDPELTNTKAIHVYEKAGFQKIEQFIPEHDSAPHWMMMLKIEDLKSKAKFKGDQS